MLLGSLLRRLRDERFAQETLIGLGDLSLVARADAAGAPYGERAADYAASACARFGDHAGDEDWLALMTALERSTDPAATCLRTMTEWALKDDAAAAAREAEGASHDSCGCGGGGGCGSGGRGGGGHGGGDHGHG